MNKSRLLVMIVCLFLVHTSVAATVDTRTFPLNLSKKVSPTETSIKELFAKEFNILAFALGIYHLDVIERFSKDKIKEHLASGFAKWAESFTLAFDLDNIDFKKKGFTRYYPFTVNKKDFIIRIFDIREEHYLPDFEIFYEGVFETSKIGFQIIPGINTILKEKEINKEAFPRPNFATHP